MKTDDPIWERRAALRKAMDAFEDELLERARAVPAPTANAAALLVELADAEDACDLVYRAGPPRNAPIELASAEWRARWSEVVNRRTRAVSALISYGRALQLQRRADGERWVELEPDAALDATTPANAWRAAAAANTTRIVPTTSDEMTRALEASVAAEEARRG